MATVKVYLKATIGFLHVNNYSFLRGVIFIALALGITPLISEQG